MQGDPQVSGEELPVPEMGDCWVQQDGGIRSQAVAASGLRCPLGIQMGSWQCPLPAPPQFLAGAVSPVLQVWSSAGDALPLSLSNASSPERLSVLSAHALPGACRLSLQLFPWLPPDQTVCPRGTPWDPSCPGQGLRRMHGGMSLPLQTGCTPSSEHRLHVRMRQAEVEVEGGEVEVEGGRWAFPLLLPGRQVVLQPQQLSPRVSGPARLHQELRVGLNSTVSARPGVPTKTMPCS